jgi:hypothetical protein
MHNDVIIATKNTRTAFIYVQSGRSGMYKKDCFLNALLAAPLTSHLSFVDLLVAWCLIDGQFKLFNKQL